ncbi:hypothetical protein [Paludisphaera soli]|uniref:hypothetical protein n=1 Tax=Paludisphaera soli TaxID=2712865 RepID=UPI0013EA8BA8|nr:hypothetical protein [Paludisphaera soli]
MTGLYAGKVDFNPSSKVDYRLPNVTSGSDGFVTKLSSGGALKWATALGGAYIRDLTIDAAGSVYLTGSFSQTFVPGFGLPSVNSNGRSDVFVTKLSTTGSVIWATAFGGTSDDDSNGIAVDGAGTVYVVGTYRSTVDFDPDAVGTYELSNASWSDSYLLKLRQQ